MAKFEIRDDCLAPERELTLSYAGPDPWAVVGRITDSIRDFFHVSASGTNQERLNWDVSGDPIGFYSVWWIKKKLSGYSHALIRIRVQGNKSKTDNTGRFTMYISGELVTNFEGHKWIIKPVWLLYTYLFYDRAKRRYVEKCSDLILNFRNEIKQHYGISATPVPQAHSVYG